MTNTNNITNALARINAQIAANQSHKRSIFNAPRTTCVVCGRMIVWGNVTQDWFHWDDGSDVCPIVTDDSMETAQAEFDRWMRQPKLADQWAGTDEAWNYYNDREGF